MSPRFIITACLKHLFVSKEWYSEILRILVISYVIRFIYSLFNLLEFILSKLGVLNFAYTQRVLIFITFISIQAKECL